MVTSVVAYHMLQDSAANLQKDIAYAPINWRLLADCMDVSKDEDPLLFTVTDHSLRNNIKYQIESQLIEKEVLGLLKLMLRNLIWCYMRFLLRILIQ